jgi:phage tail-like protein
MSEKEKANQQSTYLAYLPEIYRETDFIGRFLKIFEKVLSGIDDDVPLKHEVNEETHEYPGVDQLLDRICDYFDAGSAPLEFLDWLAGWAALELPEDWPEEVKRRLIPQIVQLYKERGTKDGLEKFLEIYFKDEKIKVSIDEWYSPFQVGVISTVGVDTAIGGGPPGFFTVKVFIPEPDLQLKKRSEKAIRMIIDREKPAHTYYRLEVVMPFMQIGVHSTLGKDTVVG